MKRFFNCRIAALLTVLALCGTSAFAQRGGGRSLFSSPSRSFASPSRPSSPSPRPSPSASPSPQAQRSWASSQPQQKASPAPQQKPSANSAMTTAAQKAQSQQAYQASQAAKQQQAQPQQKTGFFSKPAPRSPADQAKIDRLKADNNRLRQRDSMRREQLRNTNWENRQLRERQFYGSYYGRPAYFGTSVFHDPFGSPFFWLWLMDRNTHERDTWIYHHQNELDPVRMQELRNRDAQLDQRLRALEAQNMQRDPNYVPPALAGQPDLMYDSNVMQQMQQKEAERQQEEARIQQETAKSSTNWYKIFFFVGITGFAVWFIFFRQVK